LSNNAASFFDCGVSSVPLAGEKVSGDAQVVVPFANGVLLAAVDGLGHGEEASTAATKTIELLKSRPSEDIITLVQHCHESLNNTRGVVLTLASFNSDDETLSWMGVGNVESVVIRAAGHKGPPHHSVVLRGGVVGYQLPPLKVSVLKLAAGDTLIFATDGIQALFWEKLNLTFSPDKTAADIMSRFSTGTDDALVLVARYQGLPQ
jgi:phosphoserine phosphatase RsbX